MTNLQAAWTAYQEYPNDDTLDTFLRAAADDPDGMTDAMRKTYKLATGGAQPLPTVTVTARKPIPWGMILAALLAGAAFMLWGDEDDE